MNRAELAALIAANPPGPTTSSSPTMYQHHMQNPISPSSSSPKVAFQSRVRSLQQQRSPSPSRSRSTSSRHRRRHSELEQVSTLRVTHKRSQSAQTISQETPNFLDEEREAWSQKSPKSSPSRRTAITSGVLSPTRPKQEHVLSPPRSQTRPTLQPQKKIRERVLLRSFEPLQTITDVDERPKTARGQPKLEILEEAQEDDNGGEAKEDAENDDDDKTPTASTSSNMPGRSSKFMEGSMTERSSGVASSWFQDGLSDSDKPLPPTPPSKHVTFSITPVHDSLEDERVTELPTTKKKERKGLRRSISNFNFQALSEKMKIFSHETTLDATEKKKPQKPDTGIDLLNDRKRKADEAYAVQFGFKKQKFSTSSTGAAAPSPNVGHTSHHSTTDQTSHPLRTSRPTFSTPNSLRHKKSRRELEKENAELRARLAQQDDHAHHFHVSQAPAPATATRSAHESFMRGKAAMLSPGKKRGISGEDVPPVPRLPGRGALRVLENGKRRSVDGGGMQIQVQRKGEWGGGRGSLDERREFQGKIASTRAMTGTGPQWEWPEDVF
jgi:hypothetical protein